MNKWPTKPSPPVLLWKGNPQPSVLGQRRVEFLWIALLLVALLPVGIRKVGADAADGVAHSQLVLAEARQVHDGPTGGGGEEPARVAEDSRAKHVACILGW